MEQNNISTDEDKKNNVKKKKFRVKNSHIVSLVIIVTILSIVALGKVNTQYNLDSLDFEAQSFNNTHELPHKHEIYVSEDVGDSQELISKRDQRMFKIVETVFASNHVYFPVKAVDILKDADETRENPTIIRCYSKNSDGYVDMSLYKENKILNLDLYDISNIKPNAEQNSFLEKLNGVYLSLDVIDKDSSHNYMVFNSDGKAFFTSSSQKTYMKFLGTDKENKLATFMFDNGVVHFAYDHENDEMHFYDLSFKKVAHLTEKLKHLTDEARYIDLTTLGTKGKSINSLMESTIIIEDGSVNIFGYNKRDLSTCELSFDLCFEDEDAIVCPIYPQASYSNTGIVPIISLKSKHNTTGVIDIDVIEGELPSCGLHAFVDGEYKIEE